MPIAFPAVDKGDQDLSGFAYSAASVTFGSAAPTVTVPTVTAPGGAPGALSYEASPAAVCTVDPTSGALTILDAGACVVTVTAAGTVNHNKASDSFTVTVQEAGSLALTLDTIAGDGTVNIAEKASGFTISGDTGTEAGVTVAVTIGGTTLDTTSADESGTATWSVSVPGDASYITGTSVDVSVSASKAGSTAPEAVARTLTVDLVAPTAPAYTAPGSPQVGVAIASMSPSGGSDIAAYEETVLPSGLSIDTTTGVIDGTPDTAGNASTVTVTVSDTAGNTAATVPIAFPAVDKGDQDLSGFAYSAASVTFGSAVPTVTVPTVTAPGGAPGALSYEASPAAVCTVNASSGALTLVGTGDCVVTVTAAGTVNHNEASDSFTVTVQEAGSLALTLDTIAGDGTVNIAEKASGFEITGDTGTEAGVTVAVTIGGTTLDTTSADESGTATWSVSVPGDASYITGTSVDVSVSASKAGSTAPEAVARTLTVDLVAPTAPAYTAPGSLQVGVAIASMSPSGGSDIAAYEETVLPSGLSIDAATGVIDGTPDTAGNASTVTVTVSDAAGNPAPVSVAFPAVDKGEQDLSGFAYSAASVTFGSAVPTVTVPTVTAPGGAPGALSYEASPAAVCTVNASSGALTLVGTGDCVVTATAAATPNYDVSTAMFTVKGAGGGRPRRALGATQRRTLHHG